MKKYIIIGVIALAFIIYVIIINSGSSDYIVIDNITYEETKAKTNLVKIDVKDKGIIIAELYPEIAPITVQNFKNLVENKFYDGLIFHRVIKDFVIQTGDPSGTGNGGSAQTIKGEFAQNGVKNTLSHTRGVLSMARRGGNPETAATMDSASSQFFIVHNTSTDLDGRYAGFGKVIHGIEVVDAVAEEKTNSNDKPLVNQVINSIRFVKEVK